MVGGAAEGACVVLSGLVAGWLGGATDASLVGDSVAPVDASLAGGRVVAEGNVTEPPPEPPHAATTSTTASVSAANRVRAIGPSSLIR